MSPLRLGCSAVASVSLSGGNRSETDCCASSGVVAVSSRGSDTTEGAALQAVSRFAWQMVCTPVRRPARAGGAAVKGQCRDERCLALAAGWVRTRLAAGAFAIVFNAVMLPELRSIAAILILGSRPVTGSGNLAVAAPQENILPRGRRFRTVAGMFRKAVKPCRRLDQPRSGSERHTCCSQAVCTAWLPVFWCVRGLGREETVNLWDFLLMGNCFARRQGRRFWVCRSWLAADEWNTIAPAENGGYWKPSG